MSIFFSCISVWSLICLSLRGFCMRCENKATRDIHIERKRERERPTEKKKENVDVICLYLHSNANASKMLEYNSKWKLFHSFHSLRAMLHYYHDNHIIFHTIYTIFALCTKRARSEWCERENPPRQKWNRKCCVIGHSVFSAVFFCDVLHLPQ